MLPFITLCVPSHAGHVEVVRAIYPYVAQHVSWCQPRRPDSVAWAELLQYHHYNVHHVVRSLLWGAVLW